jgi:hypothetical protein
VYSRWRNRAWHAWSRAVRDRTRSSQCSSASRNASTRRRCAQTAPPPPALPRPASSLLSPRRASRVRGDGDFELEGVWRRCRREVDTKKQG